MTQHWSVPFTVEGDMLRQNRRWHDTHICYRDPIPFCTTLQFVRLHKTINNYPYVSLADKKGHIYYMFFSDFNHWLTNINHIERFANSELNRPAVRGIYMFIKKGHFYGIRLVSTEVED